MTLREQRDSCKILLDDACQWIEAFNEYQTHLGEDAQTKARQFLIKARNLLKELEK